MSGDRVSVPPPPDRVSCNTLSMANTSGDTTGALGSFSMDSKTRRPADGAASPRPGDSASFNTASRAERDDINAAAIDVVGDTPCACDPRVDAEPAFLTTNPASRLCAETARSQAAWLEEDAAPHGVGDVEAT